PRAPLLRPVGRRVLRLRGQRGGHREPDGPVNLVPDRRRGARGDRRRRPGPRPIVDGVSSRTGGMPRGGGGSMMLEDLVDVLGKLRAKVRRKWRKLSEEEFQLFETDLDGFVAAVRAR